MKKIIRTVINFILLFILLPHAQVCLAHGDVIVFDISDEEEAYEPTTFAVVDITEMDIEALQKAVDDGLLTYEQIMRLYLDRIYVYGDMYNCLTQISDTALEEAIACDQIYKEKGRSSILFGLPAIVKDNLDVAGMATTNGNKALENKIATKDAPVIAALKDAGAIIVAKANMDRYAEHSQYSISDYGRVNNALNLSMSSYGSSGGSAVAAASSLAPICIGTDTNASIRVPAGANGVVGLRPTYGLLSVEGLTPCVKGRDTVGPIARTVKDAAIILSVLDESDIDYCACLDASALDGMRIGVIDELWNFATPDVRAALDDTLIFLESQGAEIVRMPIAICDDWENGVGWYGSYFNRMMDQYDVEVAIHPTMWDTVKTHGVAYGSLSSCGSYVAPSAGVPSVSVPIGVDDRGLPYSMEFVARKDEDSTALVAAYAFEQTRNLHIKTMLAPNLYEIPEQLSLLYEIASEPIYKEIEGFEAGSEVYATIVETYQSAVDYLESSYYNNSSANQIAYDYNKAYADAVWNYRFAYIQSVRPKLWSTLRTYRIEHCVEQMVSHLNDL